MPKGRMPNEVVSVVTDADKPKILAQERAALPAPLPQMRQSAKQISNPMPSGTVSVQTDSRTPPQNLEAEESVLGSILLDNDQLTPVRKIITPDDFYKQGHRVLFSVFIELYDALEPVDLVTVTERLRQRKQLEAIGGTNYLIGLAENVPTAAYAQSYADIVKRMRVLRDVIALADQARQSAYDNVDPQDLLPQTTRGFTNLILGQQTEQQKLLRTIERVRNLAMDGSFVQTGYRSLDRKIGGLPKDDLTIIGARTSHGKGIVITSFLKNIIRRLQTKDPKAFCLYISPDQSANRIIDLEVCKNIGIPKTRFRQDDNGVWIASDYERAVFSNEVDNLTTTGFLSLCRIRDGATPLDVLKQEMYMALEEGCQMVVIDTIQRISPVRGKYMTKREIVEETAGFAKDFAIEYDVPVVAMSQVKGEVDDRPIDVFPGRRPLKGDLAEAPGSLAPIAGMMLNLYNHQKHEPNPNSNFASMEICVVKDKSGEGGSWEHDSVELGIQKDLTHLYCLNDLSTMLPYHQYPEDY